MGELLQFNREFCETTIRDLLDNSHIDDNPPQFSNKECTEMFLLDGIKVAFADYNLHIKEYSWMQEIASQNGISYAWLSERLTEFLNSENNTDHKNFELEDFVSKMPLALSVPA